MRTQWHAEPHRFGKLGAASKEAFWVAHAEQYRKYERWLREEGQRETERHWQHIWQGSPSSSTDADAFWA